MKCPFCGNDTQEFSRYCCMCGGGFAGHASARSFSSNGKDLVSLRLPGSSWGANSQTSMQIILDVAEAELLRDSLAETIEQIKEVQS